MKKMLLFLIMGILALPVSGQKYEPRETWPFIYETFQPGNARTSDGTLVTNAPFNVAVHDGSLMYVGDDGKIMRSDMGRIYTALVGDAVYLNVGNRMYQVLSELDCGVVLLGTEIDTDKLNSVSIGYGITSSTASAQNLAILMDGRFNTLGKSIQQSELDKYSGSILPVRKTHYLKIGLNLIPVSRQEILNLPGVDRKAANDFFKKEKIKWQEVASMEKLLVFVSGQLSQ